MIRPLSFVFVLIAVVGFGMSWGAAGAQAGALRVVEPDPPAALPEFALKDHRGKPFTAERFKGKWTLLAIGFTSCPDVCPFVLSNLDAVVTPLSTRVRPDNLPQVIFVAVDPKRDAPVLGEYVRHFNDDYLGVTGSHDELKKFVVGIDGFYRIGKPDKDGDYEVQHSASVIVIGPDARIHAKLSPPLPPGEVAEYIAQKRILFAREQRTN